MAETQNSAPKKKFSEFLESTPPYLPERISDLFGEGNIQGSAWIYPLEQPDVQLHCETCEGPRYFQNVGEKIWVSNERLRDVFLNYVCRNCRNVVKNYAVRVKRAGSAAGEAVKYGETTGVRPRNPCPSYHAHWS